MNDFDAHRRMPSSYAAGRLAGCLIFVVLALFAGSMALALPENPAQTRERYYSPPIPAIPEPEEPAPKGIPEQRSRSEASSINSPAPNRSSQAAVSTGSGKTTSARQSKPAVPTVTKDPFTRPSSAPTVLQEQKLSLLQEEPADSAGLKSENSTPSATEAENELERPYGQGPEKSSRFLSTSYLLRVFGILALLLSLFFLVAKFLFLKRGLLRNDSLPMSSVKTGPSASSTTGKAAIPSSLLQFLFPRTAGTEREILRPRILSQLRLSPAKEIHVVQIGDQQLVIGSTSQQMTLLTEIRPQPEQQAPLVQNIPIASSSLSPEKKRDKATYRKYLSGPKPTPAIPEEEEVFLLEDYEDQYERP